MFSFWVISSLYYVIHGFTDQFEVYHCVSACCSESWCVCSILLSQSLLLQTLEEGGVGRRSRQTTGEEMIMGEMAGSVSCTDRKQETFLIILSLPGLAAGTGSKTGFHLAFVCCTVPSFASFFSSLLFFPPTLRVYAELIKKCEFIGLFKICSVTQPGE